ncbi:MAG: DUF2384 domain-containing protein, partial [Chloroflexi bacterium]
FYRVYDSDAVAGQLDEAEEFHFDGPSADHPEALHFNWLLRGRSHVPEEPRPKTEGLVYNSQWFLEPGLPKYRSLGDVMLWPDRLGLSCLSRARLEAGKALLKSLLGELISHQEDEIKPVEDILARRSSSRSPARSRVPSSVAEAETAAILHEEYAAWVDRPIKALDGKTPREAVKRPEGRSHVIELLKAIEFLEEERRRAGKPWYDVNQIRRELGLPIP